MTTFSKQAELDFMHNFRHDTEGDRWAKHEIETLRQQLAERDKQVMLLHFELFNSAEYIDTLGGTSLEARKTLAATEQWK